eukprot:g50619.t1
MIYEVYDEIMWKESERADLLYDTQDVTDYEKSWKEANYEGKSLDFSSQNLGAFGASAVAKGLQDHPSVTSVDLRGNDLSVESGSALAAVAKQNPRMKEICRIPLDSLRDNKTSELNLPSRSLGPAEVAILAEFLKVNTALQVLNLYGNKIGPEGAAAIADMLKENKECKLEKLDVSYNQIGAEGAEYIAKAFEVNQTLTTLTLWDNKIGAEGAAHIAAAVKENKTLRELNMYKNYIGPDGAKAFAKALEVNSSLKTLDLGFNGPGIGDEEVKHIAAALKVNNMLTSLELSSNNIGDADIGAAGFSASGGHHLDQEVVRAGHEDISSYY